MRRRSQNIIIVLFVLVLAAISLGVISFRFQAAARREADALFARVKNAETETIEEEALAALPPLIREWLVKSGVVGQERIISARVRQTFNIRLSPERPWMEGDSYHYIITEEPGFVWIGRVVRFPFVRFDGKQVFVEGSGRRTFPLLAPGPGQEWGGPEADQSGAVRYLSDIVWFPTAAVEEYIAWEQVDDETVRAELNVETRTVSGIFTFDENSMPKSFRAVSYEGLEGVALPLLQSTEYKEIRELDGLMVPTRIESRWSVDDEYVSWYYFTINKLEFNETKRFYAED